jgi:hypothetical protein
MAHSIKVQKEIARLAERLEIIREELHSVERSLEKLLEEDGADEQKRPLTVRTSARVSRLRIKVL